MSIVSTFPAGGGAKLNIKAYATVGSLPASDKEGAIAVITATALGTIYGAADNPSTPSSGDILVWLGASSLAPVTLKGNLTIYPRAIYQHSGSAWALKESYVYTGGAWVEVTLSVYDTGEEILSTLSQVNYGSNYAECAYTKNAGNINFQTYASSAGERSRYMWSDQAVDLTDVTSVKITYAQLAGDNTFTNRLVIGNSRTGSYVAAATMTLSGTTATVDVSALSGGYYIGTYLGRVYGQTQVRIDKIELIK